MKKVLVLTISSLFLVACGGGGGGDSVNAAPSLSDISGVWDARQTIGDEVDEVYVVIKDYGEVRTYDYYGDAYDQGSDCYYTFSDAITDLGNGSFESTSDDNQSMNLNITLSGNQLVGKSSEGVFTFSKSPLQESDFSPLCNEISASSRSVQNLPSIKKGGIVGIINRNQTIR